MWIHAKLRLITQCHPLSTYNWNTNTDKCVHKEHLKAGSVLLISGANGEFIKTLPLATDRSE